MKAVNYTELRKNMKTHLDQVCEDHDPLIVTRKDNKNVVILSMDEYNGIVETEYLLSTKANRDHLLKAIDEVRQGKNLIQVKLEDLLEE